MPSISNPPTEARRASTSHNDEGAGLVAPAVDRGRPGLGDKFKRASSVMKARYARATSCFDAPREPPRALAALRPQALPTVAQQVIAIDTVLQRAPTNEAILAEESSVPASQQVKFDKLEQALRAAFDIANAIPGDKRHQASAALSRLFDATLERMHDFDGPASLIAANAHLIPDDDVMDCFMAMSRTARFRASVAGTEARDVAQIYESIAAVLARVPVGQREAARTALLAQCEACLTDLVAPRDEIDQALASLRAA
jgi:hypothetical protein